MKTKEIYKSPQTEVLPVAVEVNFCESLNGGAGVPGYTKDDYTPVWG
jgi:hypothetical protein